MGMKYTIPHLPLSYDLETKTVLKQLNLANKKLAELKIVEDGLLKKMKLGKDKLYQ